MQLNQEEIGKRFANLSNVKGIAEIIESKSLLNQVKNAGDEKLPLAHEKILFATISKSEENFSPETKLLSMLGRFESELSEKKDALNENKKLI